MATIKDIAEKSGLAIGTVSRIMNNRGYISDKSRKKVNEAIKELDYQPNEMARGLLRKRSNLVGIIVPILQHPYFSKLVSLLQEQAHQEGYQTLVMISNEFADIEEEQIQQCRKNRVAAIILCSGGVSLSRITSNDIPVISIERTLDGSTVSIVCDNYAGGAMAAHHLIERECRELMILNGDGNVPMPADDRTKGFMDVATQEGISCHNIRLGVSQFYSGAYQQTIREALVAYPTTDGIFTSGDLPALQTIDTARLMGRNIPEDLKVIGFDDTAICDWITPTITTIQQPLKEMATNTFYCLRCVTEGNVAPKYIKLPVKLIQRGST
ncbi:MAG: LacI family transcriptional regulator [Spirochaetia bacterium]|jgi:LacI family sucrose operon transcriptional repressor|nr:LacI family transcriptional regulator [Spirochaetia bacterium]